MIICDGLIIEKFLLHTHQTHFYNIFFILFYCFLILENDKIFLYFNFEKFYLFFFKKTQTKKP